MAARFTRIPRLTLFSGPNCSLCDVGHINSHSIYRLLIVYYQIAKAELAKVRQQVSWILADK